MSHSPSSKLVQSLLTSFATHKPSPVVTLSTSLLTPPPSLETLLSSMSLDNAIKLTLMGVPTEREEGEWTKEELWDIGEVLHEFRHSHHDHHHVKNPKAHRRDSDYDEEEEDTGPFSSNSRKGKKEKQENDLLELSKRTVLLAVGKALPSVSPSLDNCSVSPKLTLNLFAVSIAGSLPDVLSLNFGNPRAFNLPRSITFAFGAVLEQPRYETDKGDLG
jgi:hypothetical protein